jgi:hypothetical protein
MNDKDWENFIETCARQLMKEGEYIQVISMGGAGDKGRDVCGHTQNLPLEGTWDLYQAKHYEGTLAPSTFAPELAKFLYNVYTGGYNQPRNYFICALRVGPKLLDLIQNPTALQTWIVNEWKERKGNFGTINKPLDAELQTYLEEFPYGIIKKMTAADLLEIHSRSDKHWEKFGVLGPRDPNPQVPESLGNDEQKYVSALLDLYSEAHGSTCLDATTIPLKFRKHFKAQRHLFYSAEGLNRFSRDKIPGAFDDLVEQVGIGVAATVAYPHPDGMTRLKEVLDVANTLQINSNPLTARLRSGDLPGACHHLANQGDIQWIDEDE